jgi:hypothetical protein
MSLPDSFVDAQIYGVTPVDPARGRCGLSIATPDGKTFLAVTPQNLLDIVGVYLRPPRCACHSDSSSDRPSTLGSPQEGQ